MRIETKKVATILMAAVVFFGVATTNACDDQPNEKPQAVDLTNARQLDDNYGVYATTDCASGADDYLRSIAKYDFKWDDVGFLETKFDKYRKQVAAPGVLVLVSDKAKLQNGFGAYQHVELLCSYDTQSKKVLSYSVNSDN